MGLVFISMGVCHSWLNVFFVFAGVNEKSLAIGLARVGSEDQKIVAASLLELSKTDLGPPLHCLVIPSDSLHPLEADFLAHYALDKSAFEELVKVK